MKRQRKPVELKVFEAALTTGGHPDFLKKKYEEFQRGHWNPDPMK